MDKSCQWQITSFEGNMEATCHFATTSCKQLKILDVLKPRINKTKVTLIGWTTYQLLAWAVLVFCLHLEEIAAKTERVTRLVESDFPWEGRVEVFHEGAWGTVCDDSWDVEDANVVCKSLGFAGATAALPWATFGPGSGDIILDNVQCLGHEDDIFACPPREVGSNDCNHKEDAGVRCKDIRLADGDWYRNGRLEVFHDGAWGTVCDDKWNITDARVVCRSLGYGDALEVKSDTEFGMGSGSIVLDDVQCTGKETSIFNCSHDGLGVHNCVHSEDVGVRCTGNYVIDKKAPITIAADHIFRADQAGDFSPSWTFSTIYAHKLRFRFMMFDMKHTSEYLAIGDGKIIQESSELVHFSGNTLPTDVTSVSNHAWMKIVLTHPSQRVGSYSVSLKLEITAMETSEMTLDEGSSLQIKSLNFPSDYPNNAFSMWSVRAPTEVAISLILQKIELESGNDHLYLGVGVDKFTLDSASCSNWHSLDDYQTPFKFESRASVIMLIFASNHFSVRSGFSIMMYGDRHQSEAANVVNHFLSDGETTIITSANITVALVNVHCSWPIWAFNASSYSWINLKFHDFSLDNSSEVLIVGDGVYPLGKNLTEVTGNLPKDITSTSNAIWIMFRYDLVKCCRDAVLNVTIASLNDKIVTTLPMNNTMQSKDSTVIAKYAGICLAPVIVLAGLSIWIHRRRTRRIQVDRSQTRDRLNVQRDLPRLTRESVEEANVYLDTSFDYEDMYDKDNGLPPDLKKCEQEFYYSNFASTPGDDAPKEEGPLDYSGYMVTDLEISQHIQEDYINEKIPYSRNTTLDRNGFGDNCNSEFARRMKSKVTFVLPDEREESDDESEEGHCYDSPPDE